MSRHAPGWVVETLDDRGYDLYLVYTSEVPQRVKTYGDVRVFPTRREARQAARKLAWFELWSLNCEAPARNSSLHRRQQAFTRRVQSKVVWLDPALLEPFDHPDRIGALRVFHSLCRHGWQGRPLLVGLNEPKDFPAFHAYTGTHRITAARALGLPVPALVLHPKPRIPAYTEEAVELLQGIDPDAAELLQLEYDYTAHHVARGR